MADNGVLAEKWRQALSPPYSFDVNQEQEAIPGCIGARTEAMMVPNITIVDSIDDIRTVASDQTRVGFISSELPNHSIVSKINENGNYHGASVIFLPNRELVTYANFVQLEALAPKVGV